MKEECSLFHSLRRNKRFLLLFILTSIIYSFARGSNLCAEVYFAHNEVNEFGSKLSDSEMKSALFEAQLESLQKSLVNSEVTAFNELYDLARNLVLSNRTTIERLTPDHEDVIKKRNLKFKIEDLVIIKIAEHPFYPIFKATGRLLSELGGGVFEAHFRSNGHVAFLHYDKVQYQREINDRAVIRGIDNSVYSINPTNLVLLGLPSEVNVSRVMTEGEAKMWIDSTDLNFKSNFRDESVHFALNHYSFFKRTSDSHIYYAAIPLPALISLANQGLLVINSYPFKQASPTWGMDEKARTPFGLEVELVVRQKAGIREVAPYLQNIKRSLN